MQRTLTTLLGLAVGVAMLTGPDLSNIGSDAAYNSAFAAKGGNGKGGGNGNGNGGATAGAQGAGKSASNKSASLGSGKAKSKLDKSLNSRMGALHAANASASAFANSSKNSRVGRIREAILQSAAAEAAAAQIDAAIALNAGVVAAQGVYDQAVMDLNTALGDTTITDYTSYRDAVTLAQTNLDLAKQAALTDQAVIDAQTAATEAQEAADAAWEAAANKTPVSQEVKDATMALVGDKVDTSGVVVTPTTPEP